MSRGNFNQEIHQAVCNPQLALALQRATSIFAARRAEVYAGVDFKAVQAEIGEIKARAIGRLPELVATFKEEATRAGAVVHEAVDAETAARLVLELIQQRGGRRVVKSKSMLTEEIGLNKVLSGAGIEVVETDLGEWIIQLVGERPSHFVGPAIHKTREQVAEIFSKVVGRELPADPELLVKVAREHLREAFIKADVGISGANIAIAETGTLVLVTNEGNGRLVTTLPPVHIAVVGIEKIVPDLMSAASILKYLSKSAAGQKFTSYVSFITGPSRTADIELTMTTGVHGPKEVHIVLVDNGRETMRRDEDFREALHCIKCGACLNVCPVFRTVGGHVFGRVYSGGIGAVLTAFLEGLDSAADVAQLCAGCQRCSEVCTAGIDIPRLIVVLRQRMAERKGLSRIERLAFRGVLCNPSRFRRALAIARKAQRVVAGKSEAIDNLPLFLSSLTGFRSLPKLAAVPLRERLANESAATSPSPRVAFFAGCMIDYVYPEIGESVARLLRGRASVVYPFDQTCCGLPVLYAGDVATAKTLAKTNIEAIEAAGVRLVVTACPTCATALKTEFPRLLSGEKEGDWVARAAAVADATTDFAEFLTRVLPDSPRPTPGPCGSASSSEGSVFPDVASGLDTRPTLKITYHDSCHLRFGFGISSEPRELLAKTGNELVEMAEADSCCGCAGTFSLKFPDISRAMLDRKLDSILGSGADIVATGCPACLLQIRGGLRKRGSTVKAVHLAEIVDCSK